MSKLGMLYEGKAKKVYETEVKSEYIVEYKDDATAFNGVKKGQISEKGLINNQMSAILFEALEEKGVPTHFVKLLSDREMLVKAVTIIPLEVIIRNVAAGSFSKRLGVEEGSPLAKTVLEFCLKDDDLGDPLINDDHALALELATEEQINTIKKYAHEVNNTMVDFFDTRGIKLVDFKLEFGLFEGKVILADEISPDTCRLWDKETNKKLDKDRFRRDLGDVEASYWEVLNRVKNKG